MTVALRRLTETDWPVLKAIRLRALQTDPGVFGSNHAAESQYGEDIWRSWLENPDSGIFALFNGGNVIGMTGIAIDKNDPLKRKAVLWGSWLEPAWRGKGLSVPMYEARIDWARRHESCETVIVSHRASNLSSRQANQKHGFVFTHAEDKIWPDGGREDNIYYELRVKPAPLSPAAAPSP